MLLLRSGSLGVWWGPNGVVVVVVFLLRGDYLNLWSKSFKLKEQMFQ